MPGVVVFDRLLKLETQQPVDCQTQSRFLSVVEMTVVFFIVAQ